MFATIIASATMIHAAAAQPRVERHAGFSVTQMANPQGGPPGTEVHIGGNLLDKAQVLVDGRRIALSRANEHDLTFVMPPLPPGRHKIQVEYNGKIMADAGWFDMTARNGNGGIVPPGGPGQPGNTAYPPPNDPPPRPHGDWKFDRPAVLGYAPTKGEPGDRINIRGRNFTPDLQVVWNDQPIPGATVNPGEIAFKIPRGAATGTVFIRGGKLRRELPVGVVEVARYDRNEWKRQQDERRAAAEAAWRARADKIAKDKAARDAELLREQQELERSREERRRAYLAEIAARFERAFLADDETQEELALHGKHVADLSRMQRLAADLNDAKLGIRIEMAARREEDRHNNRMAALKAAFKG